MAMPKSWVDTFEKLRLLLARPRRAPGHDALRVPRRSGPDLRRAVCALTSPELARGGRMPIVRGSARQSTEREQHEFTIPARELDAGGKEYNARPRRLGARRSKATEATTSGKDGKPRSAPEVGARRGRARHPEAELTVPCAVPRAHKAADCHDLSVLYVPASLLEAGVRQRRRARRRGGTHFLPRRD